MKHSLLIVLFLISSFASAQTQDSVSRKSKPDTADKVDYFELVEEKAMFKAGNHALYAFIHGNLIIPDSLQKKSEENCIVLVTFVVEKDGSLSTIAIDPRSKGCHPALEEAALNVVKKMDGMWKPAMLKGQPNRMRFSLPIKFAF